MSWLRGTTTNGYQQAYWGYQQLIGVNVNQTVLGAYWNINVFGTWGGINFFPPARSLMRAGLLWAEDGLPAGNTPTPISQPDADWMDIETIQPDVSYTTSTQNNWHVQWGFKFDQRVKAQRRNRGPELMGLYVSFEFNLGGSHVDPFAITGWNGSIDALVSDVVPP